MAYSDSKDEAPHQRQPQPGKLIELPGKCCAQPITPRPQFIYACQGKVPQSIFISLSRGAGIGIILPSFCFTENAWYWWISSLFWALYRCAAFPRCKVELIKSIGQLEHYWLCATRLQSTQGWRNEAARKYSYSAYRPAIQPLLMSPRYSERRRLQQIELLATSSPYNCL